ncbi:glycosyl hydrolase [Aspergillus desertorum]
MGCIGRRPMLFAGTLINLAIPLTVGIAGIFSTSKAAMLYFAIMINFVQLIYAPTIGAVSWSISGEISSVALRAKTQSLCTLTNTVSNWLFNFITPYLISDQADLGAKAAFVWAALTAIAAVWVWFEVPEVKDLSFAQLDRAFGDQPHNPRLQPGPSIVRVGADYFLVTSTFEYFPGLPIYHSTDLLNWTLIGHVLTRRSQLDMRTTEPSGGVWAPTIRYVEHPDKGKGRFYVSVGCTQRFRPKEWDIVIQRGFYVTTDDIWARDSWSDPIYFDVPGIDQDVRMRESSSHADRAHLTNEDSSSSTSTAERTSAPSIKPHTPASPNTPSALRHEIALASGRCLAPPAWTCISGHGLGIAEGPHIFQKDGYYYLSTAEGGTDEGHQQWIRRSVVGPLGPWEDAPAGVDPILWNGDDSEIRCTGHADFVETAAGDWIAVFLGVRMLGGGDSSPLGRETFLAPVTWRNGWPVVNGGRRISLEMQMQLQPPNSQASTSTSVSASPADSPVQNVRTSWRDDFSGANLQLGWYHLRSPLKREYSLTDNPGSLSLYGNAYRIFDPECPSMLLQKQPAVSVDWRVGLRFAPENALEEAGTAVWWSQFAYASIGLRMSEAGKGYEISFRGYTGEGDRFEETVHPIEWNTNIELLIRARPAKYELLFSVAGSGTRADAGFTKLGEIMSSALTVRHPGRESPKTGTHFAVYAQGAYGMPCLQPALFSLAEWEFV